MGFDIHGYDYKKILKKSIFSLKRLEPLSQKAFRPGSSREKKEKLQMIERNVRNGR